MLARCRHPCQRAAMTQRSVLRQKDMERLIKAVENTGAFIQVDMKTLVVTIFPAVKRQKKAPQTIIPAHLLSGFRLAPDGKENWDD